MAGMADDRIYILMRMRFLKQIDHLAERREVVSFVKIQYLVDYNSRSCEMV